MTDLPKCGLCGHAPWPLTDEHKDTMCSNHNCVMNECSFTPDQWRTLMGHSGDAGEMVPFGHLILSGIEGGEYCDCDIAWSHKIAEKLQERYVSNDKAVYLQIYVKLPETGE